MKRFCKIYKFRIRKDLSGNLKKIKDAEAEKYKRQAREYREMYLRVLADFQNYKEKIKKMWKEKEESASEKIILKILPAIDNFERALKYSKDSKNFEAILKGVEMVYKFLMQTLEDEGLKPFDSIGKKFDPKIHEAVETVNKEDLPDEVIVEEFQRGYFFKGKLLRPAKVVVNKRR